MTPSELKALHLMAQPDSSFFSYDTMKFFGDTMKNFSVRKIEDANGKLLYKLTRKRPTRCGSLTWAAYFDRTGKHVHTPKLAGVTNK